MERARPAVSSGSSALMTSVGSQRCARAVASTVGGDRSGVGQSELAQQRFDVAGQRRGGGRGVHAMSSSAASGVSMMLRPNRFHPAVPCAREVFSERRGGGIQTLGREDGIRDRR